jgi:hypothetical protein
MAWHRKWSAGSARPRALRRVARPWDVFRRPSLFFPSPPLPPPTSHLPSQAVDGSRRVASPYALAFRSPVPAPTTLCTRTLSPAELATLREAVLSGWYFQLSIDGLPVYNFLGRVDDSPAGGPKKVWLFTRLHFDLAANGDRIVEAAVAADQAAAVELPEPEEGAAATPLTLTFSYTAAWRDSDTPPAKRMARYARETFLPHHLEVHWFSLANAAAGTLLLTGFLATILARVLRADVRRYGGNGGSGLVDGGEMGSGGELGDDDDDEAGWKQLHADVFRFPPAKAAFCAAVGTGAQLLTAAAALFGASLFGAFRPHARGTVAGAALGLYALSAGVAGYTAGSYFRQLGGRAWVRCTLATCAAFCGPLFAVFCVNNSVALAYRVSVGGAERGEGVRSRASSVRPSVSFAASPPSHAHTLPTHTSSHPTQSTAALPAGTIAALLALWAAVTLPLTVAGAIIGKNARPDFYAPVRTAKFPREVRE